MSEIEELKAELDKLKADNLKREIEAEKKKIEEAKAKEEEERQKQLREEIRNEILADMEKTKGEESKLDTQKEETLTTKDRIVTLRNTNKRMKLSEFKKETADFMNGELYHFYQSQGYRELPAGREVTGFTKYEDLIPKIVMKSKRRGRTV